MNLWVNRIGQLLVLAVALFFLACEDENSLLGFKPPSPKFESRYVEIPLESTVMLLDFVRTSNFYFANETNRLLVGNYQDDAFGHVSSNAYIQYLSNSAAKLPADAAFDSITLQLRFDFYSYGPATANEQTITIHELTEDMKPLGSSGAGTERAFNPVPIGTKSFTVDPVQFNKYVTDRKDTVITVNIKLDNDLGASLFEAAIRWRDANNPLFNTPGEFFPVFKGLLIKPDPANDKIIGFNPGDARSRVILHYNTGTANRLELSLGTFGVNSYSQIINDRSGTELSGLMPSQPQAISDMRYIQSGTGVVTNLNFQRFLDFADTVPNIIISSAQLVIEVDEATLVPPPSLSLRVLDQNNRRRKFNPELNSEDLTDFSRYKSYLSQDFQAPGVQGPRPAFISNDSTLFPLNDDRSGNILQYSSTQKRYSGFISTFLQQLSRNDGKTRYTNFALFAGPSAPVSLPGNKSVNRVTFNKDKIKLRIYYTKPTVNQN